MSMHTEGACCTWHAALPSCISRMPPLWLVRCSLQNLIILLQLSERTRGLAPGFSRMLLKLYAYAVLPVTLWVSAFATNLSIPVLR